MLSRFPQSDFVIVGQDGQLKGSSRGLFTNKNNVTSLTTEDTNIDVDIGDEVRRVLPNGKEEVFDVTNTHFNEKFHSIPAHYAIKVWRKGTMAPGTGGNYVNVTGHNARVVIGSTDNSSNTYGDNSALFKQVKDAITSGIADPDIQAKAIAAAQSMQSSSDPKARLSGYQALISTLADHVTIIVPFLPALSSLLSQ